MTEQIILAPGDRARKVGGSYEADGTIVAAFVTRAGAQRYVFEFDNPAGMLHIFGPQNLIYALPAAQPSRSLDWPDSTKPESEK